MNVIRSISGMVQVELTSADLPAAFGAISDAGVEFFRTEQVSDLTARFLILRRDFRILNVLCEKRGDTLRLCRHVGLYWLFKALLQRRVLLVGLILFLAAALYLPTKVFFIQVEGNGSIPTNRILEAAAESGIRFGASRREVRSEKVKNALLEAVPELGWAGVNTYGCVAKISVRERVITEETEKTQGYGNIVAMRDGIITSCTATNGNLLCAQGQAVTEGETLISGFIDCGICIQAVQAEGEIYARTRRELHAIMPVNYQQRQIKTKETKKISLLIGKNRINLWKDSGIWDTTCDRMYEEYYVTLPGGFQLPLALTVESCTFWETSDTEVSQEEGEAYLTAFSERYLKQQMLAGKIESGKAFVTLQDGCYHLAGEYVCTEMIGKMQRQQIGEYDGENG